MPSIGAFRRRSLDPWSPAHGMSDTGHDLRRAIHHGRRLVLVSLVAGRDLNAVVALLALREAMAARASDTAP
jgi:hypothetical protein